MRELLTTSEMAQADRLTEAEPPVRSAGTARVRRRVTTQPVPGSDPAPAPEPPRHGDGENDQRLLRERPPHWG